MTAHDQIRAMLDQLMGTGRNGEYEIVQFLQFLCSLKSVLRELQKWRNNNNFHVSC